MDNYRVKIYLKGVMLFIKKLLDTCVWDLMLGRYKSGSDTQMVEIFNLRAKADLNSLCCSPSPECQKNIHHVGDPLESWGVMGRQSLSPKKFLVHNFSQKFGDFWGAITLRAIAGFECNKF